MKGEYTTIRLEFTPIQFYIRRIKISHQRKMGQKAANCFAQTGDSKLCNVLTPAGRQFSVGLLCFFTSYEKRHCLCSRPGTGKLCLAHWPDSVYELFLYGLQIKKGFHTSKELYTSNNNDKDDVEYVGDLQVPSKA